MFGFSRWRVNRRLAELDDCPTTRSQRLWLWCAVSFLAGMLLGNWLP